MKMCEIIIYPADGWSEEKIVDVVNARASIKEWAFILHNSDVEDNGEPKKPHYHCYLNFGSTNCTVEHIAKWFNTTPNMVQYIKAKKNGKYYAIRYFLHIGCEDKHLYSVKEITANFDVAAFLENEHKKIMEKANLSSILDACADGTITGLNVDSCVPTGIYSKHKIEIERALELYELKQKHNPAYKRTTRTIYVYGESGVGKTLNCKLFAQSADLTFYTTMPGKNPFDEYLGEAAIILDEIRPREPFSHHELLKMLDPYNSSMAPARYANKFLQNSHYFLTSIFSPEEFWQGFGLSQKDTACQFYRRLAEVWNITKDKIYIYNYLDNEFKQVGVIDNPATQFLAKQKPVAAAISTQDIFQKIFLDIQQDKLSNTPPDQNEAC